MTPAEQLRAAKALIDTPEKWTRGTYARRIDGRPCGIHQSGAVCFCAAGALGHAAGGMALANFDALRAAAGKVGISAFNDAETTTHADVMALFDRAITLTEQTKGGE